VPRPRAFEALLLLAISACLFFGGGLGCEPVLEGTTLRVVSLRVNGDIDRYVAFQGKKSPGNGWAVLRYPVTPTFGFRAQVGVKDPLRVQDSLNADACIGFRQDGTTNEYRLCARYETANLHVFSNLTTDTADCPGETNALLEVIDDGVDVTLNYACPGQLGTTLLDEVPSQWNMGERWFPAFGAYNLAKGGEAAFDDVSLTSDGPFDGSLEAGVAFSVFDGLRFGISAARLFEDDDFLDGSTNASIGFGAVAFARFQVESLDLFPGTKIEKDLVKADKTYFKLVDKLQPDKTDKYLKSFSKLADLLACLEEDIDDF
jgi:hypothetical protein